MIKSAVVKEGVSPSAEDGKPCKIVVKGEPVMTKEAASALELPKINLDK